MDLSQSTAVDARLVVTGGPLVLAMQRLGPARMGVDVAGMGTGWRVQSSWRGHAVSVQREGSPAPQKVAKYHRLRWQGQQQRAMRVTQTANCYRQ